MKKILFIIAVLTLTIKVYSQDSIVNYLDNKGVIVKKNNAIEIETIVKKDTLWKVTKYFRNSKLKNQGHYKTKDKKIPVGEFITFNKKGKVSSIIFYDLYGKKKGPYKAWFDNRNINVTGIYLNDMKEGIWKYYHYNGKEACRQYIKNDSIVKTVLHNENGDIVNGDFIKERKPEFRGGIKKFNSKLKKLTDDIDFEVEGKINVNFVLNIDGKIEDVEIDDNIPDVLNKQIVTYFEKIEGWQPAIHMNRKYPVNYSIPLNFK